MSIHFTACSFEKTSRCDEREREFSRMVRTDRIVHSRLIFDANSVHYPLKRNPTPSSMISGRPDRDVGKTAHNRRSPVKFRTSGRPAACMARVGSRLLLFTLMLAASRPGRIRHRPLKEHRPPGGCTIVAAFFMRTARQRRYCPASASRFARAIAGIVCVPQGRVIDQPPPGKPRGR
jgi:hypothetical protein